jgi:hypothetical protein
MRRGLSVLFVICAAWVCAGCSAWRMAVARAEIRRIEEDWGVAKRLRILEKKRLWEESIYGRE